jgi:hypothetical protein
MRRSFILSSALFLSISFISFSAMADEAVSLDAPIQFYLVEKIADGRNENTASSFKIKKLFMKQFRIAGLHVLDDLEPPFVSQAMARYGLNRSGKFKSSGIGYVHLVLMDDDTAHYVSDSGQEVTLKSDLNSVAWVFEKKKALEMADKAGAKYALVVEVTTKLVYQDNSPKPVYNVSLDANLYQADSGNVAFHHNESMVKLASTVEEGDSGACQFLSQRLVEELQNNSDASENN